MALSKPLYMFGLSKIEIGDIAEDGGMGTNLSQLCLCTEDSCVLSQEDNNVTEIYAEEVDDPVVVINKFGKMTLAFSGMDFDPETLVKFMGGTVSEDGKTWNAPNTVPTIEKSIKITPKQGVAVSIPRASITAKINAELKKTSLSQFDVVATILNPSKVGEAKLKATVIED
ncbi:MAG: hypothetical protein HUJ96_02880 [Marinilabiliaceae bacterium]|nr:hypothetical protein [Marinilabiliaceae bacterium]